MKLVTLTLVTGETRTKLMTELDFWKLENDLRTLPFVDLLVRELIVTDPHEGTITHYVPSKTANPLSTRSIL